MRMRLRRGWKDEPGTEQAAPGHRLFLPVVPSLTWAPASKPHAGAQSKGSGAANLWGEEEAGSQGSRDWDLRPPRSQAAGHKELGCSYLPRVDDHRGRLGEGWVILARWTGLKQKRAFRVGRGLGAEMQLKLEEMAGGSSALCSGSFWFFQRSFCLSPPRGC